MQTSGLPSSAGASSRNLPDNSISEKFADSSQGFGDVMERALGSTSTKPDQQTNADETVVDETSHDNAKSSDNLHDDKKRIKTKKNSEPKSIDPATLAMAGAPGATPQSVAPQTTGNSHDSSPAQSGATPIIGDSGNPGTPGTTPTGLELADKPAASNATTDNSATTATTVQTQDPHHPSDAADAVIKELAAEAGDAKTDAAAVVEPATVATPDPQIAHISELKQAVGQTDASPPDPRGTSAAKQDMTMKKAEKTTKVAGQTEQDLPGITAFGGEEAPKGQKLSSKEEFHANEKLESATLELPLRVSDSTDSSATTTTTVAAPSTLDARVLERTHDIVALHAMRLNEYNSDSLHVVVKPGAGIQLSLELRQSARGIEVNASLHKGDFEQLRQHWPELQQRLEARGVRVGTLTTAENFTGGSHQQFHQSKQQLPNQDPLYAGAFAEFALAGSLTEAPDARAARASAYRGWETWA